MIKLNINGIGVDVPKEKFSKAIEEGSCEIKNEDLVIKTKKDYDTLLDNHGKARYDAGKLAGEEMNVKNSKDVLKDKYNIDFQGKNLYDAFEAVITKTKEDSKIEPNKKIEELTLDIEKLRGNLTEAETKYVQLEQSIQTEKQQQHINELLLNSIPKDAKIVMDKNDLLILFKNKRKPEIKDGKEIVYDNGKQMKNDQNLNPITFSEAMNDFIVPFLKNADGGTGEEDKSGNNKMGSMAAFEKEMNDSGIRTGSVEFNREMNKRIREKTLTV